MATPTLPRHFFGVILGTMGLLLPGCFFEPGGEGAGGEYNSGGSGSTGSGGEDGSGTGSTSGDECNASAECGNGQQCVSGTCRSVDAPSGNYCAPTSDWPESSAAKELEILDLVNQYRAAGATCGGDTFGPQEPLEMLGTLQCAARVHTLDMLENDYFSHTGLDGSGPDDRMEAAGYDGRGWGENIAAGNAEAADTMEQWMNSDGHCRNIMGNYRYIGVGYVEGGERRHLWTQTFGN